MTSQAIVVREPAQPGGVNWSLEQVEVGSPGDDEVLVEIYAAGICHTDIVLSSVPAGVAGIQYPKVVGHEEPFQPQSCFGAGIVRGVGKDIQSVQVGDPVLLSFDYCSTCQQCETSHPAYCDSFTPKNYVGQQGSMKTHGGENIWSNFFGQSSFAQYSVVKTASVVNVKDLIQDLSELKLFASLGCGLQTGMGAITNISQAGPDDIVLISGMGAVGMAALMDTIHECTSKTANITKCKAIIAVDKVKSRLQLAKALGATHTIDTSDAGYPTLGDAVRSLVPTGASIAIDTTGVPSIIEQSIQSTQARGKTVLIGVPPWDYNLGVNAVEHVNAKDYQKSLDSMKDGSAIKPVLIWKA
ncbi:alcohol dehydrogenase [Penicillium paradoxum]|uniref:alcohol dehydrogenase n=1 Tax=Penicillium paradoxum TaxID=176176 RepID=UPI00254982E5|nr:alcohol dehydrogenase [Penicillium paradoxum]KAJ5783177.1 alcohol dehydrogenase [Penicillium paradoxum]